MDPITIGMAVSTALAVGGTIVKGQNDVAALKQQEATQNYNAQIGFKQAEIQRAAGAAQEEQIRAVAQRQLGGAFAIAAQSGTRGGSTAAALHDIAVQGELDSQNTAFNADEHARATYIGAQQADYAARVAKSMEGPARWGADISAAGALSSGAARMSPRIE